MKRILLAVGLTLALAAPSFADAKLKPVKLPPPAWRDADAENTMVIDTNLGRIVVELVPQVAPQAVARIKQLVRMRFYDGLTFFRVIDGFMDQTGDPQNNGRGASVLPNVPPEFGFRMGAGADMVVVDHPAGHDAGFIGALPVISQPAAMMALMANGMISAHATFCQGVIGMARADAPDSGNSQFFLMRDERASLDGKYTAFGRVVVGQDVVRAIKVGEPPLDPQDRMQRVQMLADIPEGVRPAIKVIDTKSAYFAALVNNARVKEGDDFGICDVDVAGKAK